jgi:hypothetical protein
MTVGWNVAKHVPLPVTRWLLKTGELLLADAPYALLNPHHALGLDFLCPL